MAHFPSGEWLTFRAARPSGQLDVQLSLQHETIQVLVNQLGGAAEGDHDEVRRLWQDGHAAQALEKLRAKKTDRMAWSLLPAATRAKFLRLEGRLILASGELVNAKRLAAEADGLDSSQGGRLSAMIAQAEGNLDQAISVLRNDPDPDSQALRAAVLIQANRIDEALETLTALPDHPDSHRLLSLIHLAKREPIRAKAEAEKALALAPSWYWVRRTAATMRYLAGISPVVVPNRFPDWPEPINHSLIRQDDESVAARRAAALEFERLGSRDFDHSVDELSCINSWRIACLVDNPDTRQDAINLARHVLHENPADHRALSWVLGRDLNVSVNASISALEQRLSDGKAGVEEVVSLVAAHTKAGRLPTAKQILHEAKPSFLRDAAESLWEFWDRQLASLEALSRDSVASSQEKAAQALARLRTAESAGERETTWQQYLLLAQLGRWDEIAPAAKELVSSFQTPDAARLGSYALYNIGDFAGCLEILDQAPRFYFKGELPSDLRHLRVLAQKAVGALPDAIRTAREGFERARTRNSLLELSRLHFQVGDFKSIAIDVRHHAALPDLTAFDCLQLAFYLKFEDPTLALTLWKRALESRIHDDHVGMAFEIASNLGVGAETKPLVHRLTELAAEGRAGVQSFHPADLPAWFAARREQRDDVYAKLTAAELPNHTALNILGVGLARAFHRIPLITASHTDGRSAGPIFQRFGGRVSSALPATPETPWRLNADVTAILNAAHFGLLSQIESEFGRIRIPQNTILALTCMQDGLRPGQPDRIAAMKRVLGAVLDGRVARAVLAPVAPRQEIDGDVAEDVLGLLKHADAIAGLVLDFLPVRSVDPLQDAYIVSPRYATLLRDAHSVVDGLAQCGALSLKEREKAIEALGVRHDTPQEVAIPAGTRLICRLDVVRTLALAGVLDVTAATFRLEVSSDEVQREQVQLENSAIAETDAEWVGRLADHLRTGLHSGLYELLPMMSSRRESSEAREWSPEETVLLDLLQFTATDSDIIWIDDRWMTSIEQRDGMRIVGTVDLLLHLKELGRISAAECSHALTEMRAADIRFIAFDEDELLAAILEAPVENDRLVETKSLRVIRQYYARCLLQAETLRPPTGLDGAPSPSTEWNFLLGCGRAVVMALLRVFETADNHAQARFTWLIRNMYSDDRGIHGTAALRTLDNDEYRASVSLVSLITNSLHLDSSKARRRARREYLKWLYRSVIRPRFAADRDLAAATIDQLKRMMTQTIERDEPVKEAVLMRLIGRLWSDLPAEIRLLTDTDQEFLRSIGASMKSIAEIGPVRVERQLLWTVLAQILADGEPRTIEALDKAPVELERVSVDPIRFRIKCEEPRFEGSLAGDEFGFLSDSYAVRETSAARLGHWFDMPQDRREDYVARAISGQNASTRMDLVAEARKSSVEELYRRIFESIKEGGTFRLDETLPADARNLLDHLRLNEADGSETRWSQAATRLVADLGVVGTVIRLGGIPVPLSDEISNALLEMPPARRRRSMRVIRKVLLASPTGVVQLAHLWSRLPHAKRHGGKIQTRLAHLLCSDAHRSTFDAWVAALRWVQEQFGFNEHMRALPADIRLALVWAHADRLFRILMAKGLPPEWIEEAFDRKQYPVAPELIFPDASSPDDVASPQRLRAEVFALAGLASIACDEGVRSTLRNLVQTTLEAVSGDNQAKWFYPLVTDTSGATNILGSWLNNTAERVALLPSEVGAMILPDALATTVREASAGIAAQTDERLNWLRLLAVCGEFPLPDAAKDALEDTLLGLNIADYVVQDPWIAVAALRLVSQHAKEWSATIRGRLQTQCVDLARQVMNISSNDEVRAALSASILDAAISCVWWNADMEERAIALATMLERLADAEPAVFEGAGLLISQLCHVLPVRESRHLWRTLDLFRKSIRL